MKDVVHLGTVWYCIVSKVWCVVVGFGLVWYSMVWNGMKSARKMFLIDRN